MKKLTKNKTTNAIALFLMFSMAISIFALPQNVTAQQYTNLQEGGSIPLPSGVTPDYSLETSANLAINPNPAGVGQDVLIFLFMMPPIHPSRYYKDMTIKITNPDGQVQVVKKDSFRADTTAYHKFVPDKAGNWTIEFEFPGGYFPPGNYSTLPGAWAGAATYNFNTSSYYKPSTAKPIQLVVQEDPAASWPGSPLPTDYWTRPASPMNREWWPILGYYPSTGVLGKDDTYWPANTNKYALSTYGYVPYTSAPLSPHVMWKKELTIGGLIGGSFETTSLAYAESHYSSLYAPTSPQIIYAGRAYHDFTRVLNGEPTRFLQCYDIRTGEVYWERTNLSQVPQYVTYWEGYSDVPGSEPLWERHVFLTYVGGGRLINYHPMTGAVMYNVSISPFTTGTLYGHFDAPLPVGAAGGGDVPYFKSVQNLGSSLPETQRYRLITWTVAGDPSSSRQIVNVRLQVTGNISWPFSSLGNVDFEAGLAYSTASISYPSSSGIPTPVNVYANAVDLKTGQLLWNVSTDSKYPLWSTGGIIADQGKLYLRFENGVRMGFDGRTGSKIWEHEMSTIPWGAFNAYGIASYGGMVITGQYDGVAAYDWKTGDLAWLYKAKPKYPVENFYGDSYPFFTGSPVIADGIVFMSNGEHTPTNPITREWRLHAINATTGEGIWSISGSLFQISGGTHAGYISIHDGYLVFPNSMDGYQYVYGKGPSATTLTAPDRTVMLGDTLVIKGTVTDQSSAQKGTAAISDENMSAWMEYLHMQQPLPTNTKGVSVTIDVIDANGNYRNIGTATSDTSGNFGFPWKPDIPGFYQVIATFKGSNSYGSSYSTAYFNVEESLTATTEPTQPPTSVADMYFVPAIAGLFVAIIVVGLLILLVLRKRP